MHITLQGTGGERKGIPLLRAILVVSLLWATCCWAQTPPQKPPTGLVPATKTAAKSDYSIANGEVALARSGDPKATLALAHDVFRNAGIPTEIADAFGFTSRILQAQTAYQNGRHAPIHEQDIVTAINNLASNLGTPQWTHTTQPEVRRLRVRLFLAIPQLFGNREPPDSKGRHALLSSNMSPLEASYLAVAMLYVKVFYSDFQFTDAERAQYLSQGPAALAAAQRQRETLMLNIVNGRSDSVSIADLLPATEHLFDDLGLPSQANSTANHPLLPSPPSPTAKGDL
jgi:hypothetical protein